MAEKVLHLAQELLEIITGRGPRPVDANLLWVPDEYFRYGQLSLEEIEEEDKKYILERDSLEQYGGEEAEFDEVSEDDGSDTDSEHDDEPIMNEKKNYALKEHTLKNDISDIEDEGKTEEEGSDWASD